LIVHVDSPGGTVAGGESLHRALTRLSAVKPVVAVMDGLATSAGYMVAIGASRVVAQRSTITGSIGVILQSADVTGLLDRIGVNMEAIKSSPLKGVPSPFEPLTEEGREATKRLVEDMYDMFVEMVVDRRQLPREKVLALADGRVFTGRQAFESGLIDGIGGEREARLWLRSEHDIDDSLPLRDVDPRDPTAALLERLASSAVKALLSERLSLDGMISVWHPEY
ncbi:MAG: signal peptide peptidase SppA, partial [Acetobacterales bacterium]